MWLYLEIGYLQIFKLRQRIQFSSVAQSYPTLCNPMNCSTPGLPVFPASGSFPMSQFFTPGGQSIGVSASASVLPMNIQDWFPFRTSLVAQFSCSSCLTLCNPYEPQHISPPRPSPTPGVHPNPCPLSQWCHPTISSSVIPFSSCRQSFPASEYFPVPWKAC